MITIKCLSYPRTSYLIHQYIVYGQTKSVFLKMNSISIKKIKMLFFFLVYIVPALTFTLSENVIKDDVEVDRKNLKEVVNTHNHCV